MKKGLWVVLILGMLVFLAACGGNDDSTAENTDASDEKTDQTEESGTSDTSSSNKVNVTATNFAFDQSEYTVSSGEEVNVSLTNKEGMHGIGIDEFDVNIQGDGEATFTPDEPGEYTIYCNVPCGEGHADMKSTLIVQ